jgi:peptidoglycan/LPS O-acetylase OafA/YrhL
MAAPLLHPQPQPCLLDQIDLAKGIAIAAIVLVHGFRGWFGWQGVHVFVVLSGFLLSYSCLRRPTTPHWGRWLRSRARRLLPSFWLIAVCGAVLVGLTAEPSTPPLAQPNAFSWLSDSWLGTLLADLLLLRNFSFSTMMAAPNSALWFIPFILSFYLVFPLLYRFFPANSSRSHWLACLGICVGLEFLYRTLAIYGLDGVPVAFGHGFLPGIPSTVQPLDRLPESFGFQKWAPFGLFPARLGAFALGMAAAFAFLRSPAHFHAILLRRSTAWLGVLIWLLGNGLVYSGLWGWIFADFVIALGLVLWLFPLCAWLASRHDAFSLMLVSALGFLGLYSYQIFLVHLLVGSFYAWLYSLVAIYTLWSAVLLLLMNVATTLAAAVLLTRLDRWRPLPSARLSS